MVVLCTVASVGSAMGSFLRCPAMPAMSEDPFSLYEVTLGKPMGLLFEEVAVDEDAGVQVSEVRNAALETIWPGDYLVSVNGVQADRNFESVMELLVAATEPVTLKLARDVSAVGRVRFPDGSAAFGVPGDELEQLARLASFTSVEYDCRRGTCGVCEMFLLAPSGQMRPIRMCKARLPAGAHSEWTLLPPDDPRSVEYQNEMQERLRKQRSSGDTDS